MLKTCLLHLWVRSAACSYGLFGIDSSAFQEETLDEAGVIQRVVDFFKETKQVS